jgi:ubiquinone/menaquinone biosynthesis C-methylase UbiE
MDGKMKSISFDRAASFYDETRGFPPGVSDQISDTTKALLPPQANVLELGAGTGRISIPLMRRKINMYGIDISSKMIYRFLEKLDPSSPVPKLAIADATKLPFPSDIFDAILGVHVFHLIAGWQDAVLEAERALKPGGILLFGYDWRPPDSPIAEIRKKWRSLVREMEGERDHPGTKDFDEIFQLLIESGAEMKEIEAASWSKTILLSEYIDSLEAGIYSSTWLLTSNELAQAAADLRKWSIDHFGSLERSFIVPRKFIWQRFEWMGNK